MSKLPSRSQDIKSGMVQYNEGAGLTAEVAHCL